MDLQFPYLMYNYKEAGRGRVAIDFLVIAMSESNYRPLVAAAGKELHIGMAIPKFFVKKSRLMAAHGDDNKFTDDTHKATAFEDLVDSVDKQFGLDKDGAEKLDLFGKPMVVKLPFPCEEDLVSWEMQAFENDDEEFTNNCAGIQYFFVLSVVLQSQEKKKEKKKGGFRVFASPTKEGEMEEE